MKLELFFIARGKKRAYAKRFDHRRTKSSSTASDGSFCCGTAERPGLSGPTPSKAANRPTRPPEKLESSEGVSGGDIALVSSVCGWLAFSRFKYSIINIAASSPLFRQNYELDLLLLRR